MNMAVRSQNLKARELNKEGLTSVAIIDDEALAAACTGGKLKVTVGRLKE
jgi:hypothetical protein